MHKDWALILLGHHFSTNNQTSLHSDRPPLPKAILFLQNTVKRRQGLNCTTLMIKTNNQIRPPMIKTNNQVKQNVFLTKRLLTDSPLSLIFLGRDSKKWKCKMAFAISRRNPPPLPPPLNGTNIQTIFTPLFFFCNWILHIWNGFYTSKISLLGPLIIGSKLTFISSSGRWLPTI